MIYSDTRSPADPWGTALALWWCANRFGVCRDVSVAQTAPTAPTAPDPQPLTLFPDPE